MNGFDIIWAILVGIGLLLMFKPLLKDAFSSPMTVEKFLSKPCPKGVKSPIYELCQKMVGNVGFLQVTSESYFNRGVSGILELEYIDSFKVTYTVKHMQHLRDNLGFYTITKIKIPGKSSVDVCLSAEEYLYFNTAWELRKDLINEQRLKEWEAREQSVRDEVTKLYSQPPSETQDV